MNRKQFALINNLVIKKSGEKVDNCPCVNCESALWFFTISRLICFCKIMHKETYGYNVSTVQYCSEDSAAAINELINKELADKEATKE